MKLVTNSFLFCFICLISISIKSQNVTANIESDSILIGKELFYTIDIDMEKAENIIFPDSTSFVPFELISDPDEKICKLFDVIKEKSMYGKKYMGIERSTFLIGPDGKLLKEWRKVKVKGHVTEVISSID